MKIYLKSLETNEILQEFDNVIAWGVDFVEYNNGGGRAKIYCDIEKEYFSDVGEDEVIEE